MRVVVQIVFYILDDLKEAPSVCRINLMGVKLKYDRGNVISEMIGSPGHLNGPFDRITSQLFVWRHERVLLLLGSQTGQISDRELRCLLGIERDKPNNPINTFVVLELVDDACSGEIVAMGPSET